MEQPSPPGDEADDVLSMGEGSPPRWGRWAAVLVVMLLSIAAYRLISAPGTPAAPEAAASTQGSSASVFSGDELQSPYDGPERGTAVRLGDDLVTLRGPGVQEPERETSAMVLERIRPGWLVRLTSTACEGAPDPRTSYGVARASGRFILWDSVREGRRPSWRSPDRALVLVTRGHHLEVRRAATGKVLTSFPAVGSLPQTPG